MNRSDYINSVELVISKSVEATAPQVQEVTEAISEQLSSQLTQSQKNFLKVLSDNSNQDRILFFKEFSKRDKPEF